MPAANIIGIAVAAFVIMGGAFLAKALGYPVPTEAQAIGYGIALGGAIGHVINLVYPQIDKPKDKPDAR